MDIKDKFEKTFFVTAVGAAGNIVLSIIKVVFGIISNSHAVLADGIHSLSDLFSDAVVVVCLKISCRPPSRDKPYGNKKLESISSLIIAAILIAVVGGMVYRTIQGETAAAEIKGFSAIVVTIISIIVKELMFRYTLFSGKKYKSSSLIANAWHHRSDALSSVLGRF